MGLSAGEDAQFVQKLSARSVATLRLREKVAREPANSPSPMQGNDFYCCR